MRADPASDRCPRCGQGFHCGAEDSAPCPCSALSLPDALQQALRERYEGCLCLRCLQALAGGAAIGPEARTHTEDSLNISLDRGG